MRCAVCSRQARGFGHFHSALPRTDPRRTAKRWQFCSMRCLDAFSRLMTRLIGLQEDAMVDPTEMEIAAMHAALAPLGDLVVAAGLERPLAEYRKEEVLRLIEVVVDAYQAHMIEEHERLAAKERAYFEARLSRAPSSSGGSR
ncbi:MAG: hypothetical protein HT579_04370 [Candidatus Accumulibacter similis]|nr:MAG: hypothetical protein HT579_04370 [Candidatus Accumulibacter similis]